jgi:hypothetical protein
MSTIVCLIITGFFRRLGFVAALALLQADDETLNSMLGEASNRYQSSLSWAEELLLFSQYTSETDDFHQHGDGDPPPLSRSETPTATSFVAPSPRPTEQNVLEEMLRRFGL